MGYTTTFTGSIRVEPALTTAEAQFLLDFSRSDHDGEPKAPGKHCDWVPAEPILDGFGFATIEHNGSEKSYDAVEWLQFLIDEFLKPGSSGGPQGGLLTRDHVLDGVIEANGEEHGDYWRLVVKSNAVTREEPITIWASDNVQQPVIVPGEIVRDQWFFETRR